MKFQNKHKQFIFWIGFIGAIASIVGVFITIEFSGSTSKNVRLVSLLEKEFQFKNRQILRLQQKLLIYTHEKISKRARKLEEKISNDASPYALALKAIAENKPNRARILLSKAHKRKEIE